MLLIIKIIESIKMESRKLVKNIIGLSTFFLINEIKKMHLIAP